MRQRLSATSAALAIAALAAIAALPAWATTGSGSGGASADPQSQQYQSQDQQSAQAADYQPARATWYGPGFFGHRTACGAVLTRATLGVANKHLACGTQVALRYRGHTLVVPVIDRGPYSRGVDFDLTYATARKLGIRHTSRLSAAALHS